LLPTLEAQRYFTPDEANKLLPVVVSKVSEVQRTLQEGRTVRAGLRAVTAADRQVAADRLEELARHARALLEDIAEAGVHVKGVEPALLDFPAVLNGQEVYLCWRDGEPQVGWWHPIQTGMAGRQPVDYEALSRWEWCN